MIDIESLKIEDLLPDSLKRDKEVLYLAQAVTETFQQVSKKINILNPKRPVDDNVLDIIAWEEHVDFYDNSLPAEQKRELIEKSTYFHQHKGTPAAVEDLIATIFGEGKVVEWFEYGGAPYTFKVVTNNRSVTQEKAELFIKALNSVKNLRSRLEKVEITQVEGMNLYFAGVLHTGDKITIRQVV